MGCKTVSLLFSTLVMLLVTYVYLLPERRALCEGLLLPFIFFTVFLSAQSTGNETTMEEELGLVGASADDTEAELIRSICETELLDGKCGCHQGALGSICLCKRTGTVGNRRRKAVSFRRKHSFLSNVSFYVGFALPLWRWFFNSESESTSFCSLQEFWDKLSNSS